MEIREDEEARGYGPVESNIQPGTSTNEALLPQLEELEMGEDEFPSEPHVRRGNKFPSYFPKFIKTAMIWMKGPSPPVIHRISPIFPSLQAVPLRLVEIACPQPTARFILLLVFYAFWVMNFGFLLHRSISASDIEGYGTPIQISCGATLWLSGNACGLDGIDCRPFNGSSFAFRCPANCASVQVLNPRAVGAQEIIYRPLVIGGPTYRGDSFICGAAIHAGVVNNADGGCGILTRIGQQRDFPTSEHNGITSIEFDSNFPLAFSFVPAICSAKDLRWPLLAVSVTFTMLLSIFTISPSVLFFTTFTSVFAHVGLVSDPPTISSIDELISDILGKFLPAVFCAFVIYRYCVKLAGLNAQFEKTILSLGGCWVGALSNYTFDWIPISRLTSHDLGQQPGAIVALTVIIIVLLIIVIQQIYYFRLEGRLLRYLVVYALLIVSIVILLVIPGFNLRIHHYILALLLLPGTSMQTRPSLLYQGILIGLFINGIARWGFDSILQTDNALRGDGQYDSILPTFLEPVIGGISIITFNWVFPSSKTSFNGISVLVNDVERYRRYFDQSGSEKFTWLRDDEGPEYFRFGYINDEQSFDYTKAGIWAANGSWIEMESGPSKI